MTKILYFNNCWFTNVGEAFIDVGSMYMLKLLFPNAQIACISDMSDYYQDAILKRADGSMKNVESKRKRTADFYKSFKADYIVLSGMFASQIYLDSPGRKMVDALVNNGSKLIFMGLGSEKYTEQEENEFGQYLSVIKPILIMTRDEFTYDKYKKYADSILGLDCAFWVRDAFNPMGFGARDFDIVTFNRSKEPANLDGLLPDVVRPNHMQYSCKKEYIREKFLMSDTPYDYLTAYANARRVYTDLVHASIPSLVYGTPVKYWYIDERSTAFRAVRCIKIDNEGFMSLNYDSLMEQKDYIINEMRMFLK